MRFVYGYTCVCIRACTCALGKKAFVDNNDGVRCPAASAHRCERVYKPAGRKRRNTVHCTRFTVACSKNTRTRSRDSDDICTRACRPLRRRLYPPRVLPTYNTPNFNRSILVLSALMLERYDLLSELKVKTTIWEYARLFSIRFYFQTSHEHFKIIVFYTVVITHLKINTPRKTYVVPLIMLLSLSWIIGQFTPIIKLTTRHWFYWTPISYAINVGKTKITCTSIPSTRPVLLYEKYDAECRRPTD